MNVVNINGVESLMPCCHLYAILIYIYRLFEQRAGSSRSIEENYGATQPLPFIFSLPPSHTHVPRVALAQCRPPPLPPRSVTPTPLSIHHSWGRVPTSANVEPAPSRASRSLSPSLGHSMGRGMSVEGMRGVS